MQPWRLVFFYIFSCCLPPVPLARAGPRSGPKGVAGPDGPFEGDYNIRRMSKRCISAV